MSRRSKSLIALIVLLGGLWFLLDRNRPHEIDIVVLLDPERPVKSISVRWIPEDDPAKDRIIEYDFTFPAGTSVTATYEFRLEIPPDTYQIRLVVLFADGTAEVREQMLEIDTEPITL